MVDNIIMLLSITSNFYIRKRMITIKYYSKRIMKKITSLFFKTICYIIIISSTCQPLFAQKASSQKVLWQIGKADNSDAEFALALSGYSSFLEKDFGWEDGFYLIGSSDPKTDWPYTLPGPEDEWGGTAPNAGWQAGYQPTFESVGTFSHIHEWTMGGVGIFATNGKLQTHIGDEHHTATGYRSRIDKKTEEIPIGYYKVQLTDYDIKAEVTATTRCGFERFTFPADRDSSRILIDLHIPAEYDYQLKEIKVKKVNDYRIEGFAHQLSPDVWSTDAGQDHTIHFVIEFDKPIKNIAGWIDEKIQYDDSLEASDVKNAGLFVEFDAKKNYVVQLRSGISLVSIDNADSNLKTEITDPFGWDFDAVRQNQKNNRFINMFIHLDKKGFE